jgi:hypothetical protein
MQTTAEIWSVPVEAALEWIERQANAGATITTKDFRRWANAYDAIRRQQIEQQVRHIAENGAEK